MLSCPSVLLLTPGGDAPLLPPKEISLKNSRCFKKITTLGFAAFVFWFSSLCGWCFHTFLRRHQKCIYLFLMKSTVPVLFWGWALADKGRCWGWRGGCACATATGFKEQPPLSAAPREAEPRLSLP